VLTIVVVSGLFSWYAANFANYEKTYGSIGALIGFLFWIWICVNVVIVGAELNSEIEHQTAQDSTEGTSKPLGQRNAKVADTVGISVHDNDSAPSAPQLAGLDGTRPRQRYTKPVLPLAIAIPAMFAIHIMRRRAARR
jgi:membrane protein